MFLSTSQMPLQQLSKKTPRSSSSSSRQLSFLQPHNRSLITFFTLCLFLLTSLVNAQAITSSTTSITISFLDTSGTLLPGSQPQTLTQSVCIALNAPTLATTTTTTTTATPGDETAPPNNNSSPTTTYAIATASDQHAALNLYTDIYCQVMVSATVGFWNTSTTTTPSLTGIKAIRWEGTAPATMTPGTLYPVAFPPNMITQPLAPVEEDGTPKKMHHHKQKFVMDPARGRAVVGLVSAIMIVGIVIGVREVYKAAQYVPPVRSRPGSILNGKGGKGFGGYGRFSGDGSVIGTVGARKVKKKEAYYRKPATSSLFSSSVGGADLQQQQLQQLSTGRSSMTTLATLRATTSPVTIDMGGSGESSPSLLHPSQGQGQGETSSLSLASSPPHSRLHIDLPPRLELLVPFAPSPVEGNNNNPYSSLMGSIDSKQP